MAKRRLRLTKNEFNQKMKELFKPYDELYLKLEKLHGEEDAKKIVTKVLQYDFRGLLG